MPTMGEVFKFVESTGFAIKLFGATKKFMKEHLRHCREIGDALIEELDIAREEIPRLPDNTTLPPKAEVKFQELRRFWKKEEERQQRLLSKK